MTGKSVCEGTAVEIHNNETPYSFQLIAIETSPRQHDKRSERTNGICWYDNMQHIEDLMNTERFIKYRVDISFVVSAVGR